MRTKVMRSIVFKVLAGVNILAHDEGKIRSKTKVSVPAHKLLG